MKKALFGLMMMIPGILTGAEQDLLVTTFNIRYDAGGDRGNRDWKVRKPVVLATIRDLDPDVLGVQEAQWNQVRDLDRGLGEYTRIGVGRADGKRKGEFCAIYFRTARFTADDAENGTFWLSGTPGVAGSRDWGNKVERICTWARLLDRNTKEGFYVFNTHWDHQHGGAREQSARLIAARVAERTHPREAVILMGDFNASGENPAVAYLLGKTVALAGGEGPEQAPQVLRRAFHEQHPKHRERGTFHGWAGNTKGAMIDQVLVSATWTVLEAGISHYREGEIWPSDHFPVWARLRSQGPGK